MDVRAQVTTVFHLDKCIGCHTCSIACKNVWTDRKGAEYMWWNNVETKPGTGYPTLWEDQEKYKGGWEVDGAGLRLRSAGRLGELASIFHSPSLPNLDDYYEPWTYWYYDLFDAPEGNDQPTARPVSLITGDPIDIKAGPNWDDDLGGSPLYAANDPGLGDLTAEERAQLFQLERLNFFYIPRICNHCLNPGCVAACPSGALYKRAEDGIVLVSQDKCRGWRFCVSGCPYKKVYFNWDTGKSEKCILCYPRQETGYAPACFHTCVGRIRYLGPVLYDAAAIARAASVPDVDLVEAHRSIILDPTDPAVIAGARANGIHDRWIEASRLSPVYKLIKLWRIALPLRSEFRTMPMLWYVPPLLPVMAKVEKSGYRLEVEELFAGIEQSRVPMRYMARLFGAGNQQVVREALLKIAAVRFYNRSREVGDVNPAMVDRLLADAGLTPDQAMDIFRMTALAGATQRHAVPPFQREMPIDETGDPHIHRGDAGLGRGLPARRRF